MQPASRLTSSVPPPLSRLFMAEAVRERCHIVYRWVADGRSAHFTIDPDRMPAIADYVSDITRKSYPDLKIPYHSRWRHFSAGGIDRWQELAASLPADPIEQARVAIDLAMISVLLDAGAGAAWRYREEAAGLGFNRSEGLAVASYRMFLAGAFSSDPARPLRVDDAGLAQIDAATLVRHFQVSSNNPLVGLEARTLLLRRLAKALAEQPDLFGRSPARPGHLVDYLLKLGSRLSAGDLLAVIARSLIAIWPSGLVLHGYRLGDAGYHPAVRAGDAAEGVVPFHKLSQWLTYSLIEPLTSAGTIVERIEELTALPEYRNGGLLIDLGAIRLRDAAMAQVRHDVRSEFIVEWRALTVALLDQLLDPVRTKLGAGPDFTMPRMLQGGTWSAGRAIARELRPPDGPPPILVAADGTVF
jgi:hypothetical protein